MFFVRALLLLSAILCASGIEESHHRHRHSKSHQEYDLDRLMNRLDSRGPLTTRATMTTNAKGIDEPDTSASDSEPGNSLWDDSSTLPPLDPKLWDNILKNKVNKAKTQEDLEDAQDELNERSDEDEEGFVDQKEQADSYRSWAPRGSEPSITSWKYENLGTRKAVENTFSAYKNGLFRPGYNSRESQAQNEVIEHHKRMVKETSCRTPKPKVIRVSDIYPSTSKLYVPTCTVLYQCGDDTGCCSGAARCAPKASATKRVELYFYTTHTLHTMNGKPRNGVEKLPFYNHTECECQERTEDVMPRDGQSMEYRIDHSQEQNNRCKCPSEFTVRWLANGSCSCDCFDKQRDCTKYKKGKEYFSHEDRVCIEVGSCQQPVCDFGAYIRSSGRCPRKHEKLRTWSRFH